MKILQVIHQDPRDSLGGSETYCRNLSEILAGKKNVVGIFCAIRGDGESMLQAQKHGRIHYFPVDLNALPSVGQRFQYTNSYANPHISPMFEKVLSTFEPDIVHVHHLLTLSVEILEMCNKQGIPLAATLHDYWYFCHRITLTLPDGSVCCGPEGGIKCKACGKSKYNRFPGILLQPGQALASVARNKRLMESLNLCDRIYSPSHSLMYKYEQEGADVGKMFHLPYGVPQMAEHTKTANGEVVFGYIGTLAPHKGLDVLLDSSKLMNGHKWKMKLFGSGDRDYENSLRKKARGLPVEFSGRFDNASLSTTLNAIDVLIVPSLWEENSPLVVYEASAIGVPVIASNIGGLPEIVSPARGGMLFNPGDSETLATLMGDIVANPNSLLRMKRKIKPIRMIHDVADTMLREYQDLTSPRDAN